MEHGKPFSATDSPLVDFDAVCQKVRAAIEPARAHAVSLHDEHGDVLWLSESSMGPDEHNAVREAVEAFSNAASPPVLVYDLGDSRSAVLLRAVNGRRSMVGAIMVVMDARVIKQDARGALKVMTPKLQRALADFAEMRPDNAPPQPPPAAAKPARAPTAAPLTLVNEAPAPAPSTRPAASAQAASTPPAAPAPPPAARSAPQAKAPSPAPATAPRAAPPQGTVSPEIDRLHAALRRSPIALHVQRLVPLAKGGQLKRYEVLLRSKSDTAPNAAPQAMLKAAVENGLGSMIDRRVITELIGYLVHHPEVWKNTAVQFSVNLTTTALHDEHFIKFVGLCLAKSSLPKGMIAFEVDTPTAVKLADKMAEVAGALHRLGCPLVLDDFALKTECFALLRLPGVHYVKLAPEITAKMRTDKLSQAAITAVVQMARVLGMHTVAKRTETAAEQEWLTALGVDFVQSNSMSPPVSIESLSKTPNVARPQTPTH
jgi:EAL domain-containing protein (putative c-di-GMP-specific phosphodiesterase class I)